MNGDDMITREAPSWKRSALKAATYRIVIVILDFVVIYLLTGKTSVAFGFMIISNIYTTAAYFFHERLWARIQWGKCPEASG